MARKKVEALGLTTSDLLRDKVWKTDDIVYFHLFPYNDPDFIQVFEGKIIGKKLNVDYTYDYAIKITCAFDKREVIRSFFYKNFFKTPTIQYYNTLDVYDNYNLSFNSYCNTFNYVDTEIAEVIMDPNVFKYSNYKTVFKNYTNQFNFVQNEVFIFDSPKDAFYYKQLHSILSIGNYLKKLHNIMLSDNGISTLSSIKLNDTKSFVRMFKEPIICIIRDMGSDFTHYLENDAKITKFFRNYILLENIRDVDYHKRCKRIVKHASRVLEKRERVHRYENYVPVKKEE